MSVHVLLGLQWGDEGKGKIVDFLAPRFDVIARFQGGPNAGHTLEFGGDKHVLHQIPAGIFHSHIQNVVGSGMVLDVCIFKEEIEKLEAKGIDCSQNLFLSKKAHLILPSHRALDKGRENAKGKNKIGTTSKGIGPTYQDKIGRRGLRVGDILDPNFETRYRTLVEHHCQILQDLETPFEKEQKEKEFLEAIAFTKKFQFTDSEYLISDAIQSQKKILAEGAQGSLLDVDFGSYPFVTSSNTIATGACTGLGIAPKHIGEVYGIFKAYCTRVGMGPFPTEQDNEIGKTLRTVGNEFGATTGRERRCGWLDLPALKYAIMLNGVTQLFMMKADVLSHFEEVKVCTHYELPDSSTTGRMPFDLNNVQVKPIYKSFKGWGELKVENSFEDFPSTFQEYLNFVEAEVQVPITIVSIGPDRTQTIEKGDLALF